MQSNKNFTSLIPDPAEGIADPVDLDELFDVIKEKDFWHIKRVSVCNRGTHSSVCDITGQPGCCGIAMVHCHMFDKEEFVKLTDVLEKVLQHNNSLVEDEEEGGRRKGGVGMFMASTVAEYYDSTRGDSSSHKMFKNDPRWMEIDRMVNPNSDNTMSTWVMKLT